MQSLLEVNDTCRCEIKFFLYYIIWKANSGQKMVKIEKFKMDAKTGNNAKV